MCPLNSGWGRNEIDTFKLFLIFKFYFRVQEVVGREKEAMEPNGTRPAAIPEKYFYFSGL